MKIKTYTTKGLVGHEIVIELDSSSSLPGIDIIGLPDASVRESRDRIRSSFRVIGVQLPHRRYIINMSPSHLHKTGTTYDMPLFMILLSQVGESGLYYPEIIEQSCFFGELGLDGSFKRVTGILTMVVSAYQAGTKHFFVPYENVQELAYLKDIFVYGVKHSQELFDWFVQGEQLQPCIFDEHMVSDLGIQHDVTFDQIIGQDIAKRALMVAAAGGHNILLVGAPGSGKTMLAKALMSILPPLTQDESLDVSKIYSIVGKLHSGLPMITHRQFRAIHHTASKISLIGGGQHLLPGEISLAHHGVLFLDELPEFPRDTLDVLRQPIEDGVVHISRASGTVQYPCRMMVVAAMNPCKCGMYKDPTRQCTCSHHDVAKYQSKISGPLLDRIDMIVEVPRIDPKLLIDNKPIVSQSQLVEGVTKARTIQRLRYQAINIISNAHLSGKNMSMIVLSDDAKKLLERASDKWQLSGRMIHRLMKVARTIADIEGSDLVEQVHVAEALQYRSKTFFVGEGG